MRALLAAALLIGTACAGAPDAAPRPSSAPAPSVPPGQTLGCTLVFLVQPAARCIDR